MTVGAIWTGTAWDPLDREDIGGVRLEGGAIVARCRGYAIRWEPRTGPAGCWVFEPRRLGWAVGPRPGVDVAVIVKRDHRGRR